MCYHAVCPQPSRYSLSNFLLYSGKLFFQRLAIRWRKDVKLSKARKAELSHDLFNLIAGGQRTAVNMLVTDRALGQQDWAPCCPVRASYKICAKEKLGKLGQLGHISDRNEAFPGPPVTWRSGRVKNTKNFFSWINPVFLTCSYTWNGAKNFV